MTERTDAPHSVVRDTPEGDERDQHGKQEVRTWLRLLACSTMIEGTVRGNLRQAYDTTLPRFDLLAQLFREPDGLTMGELSKRLMVSGGNVTMVMDRLEAEGLVRRSPSPQDRRTQYARLTQRGRRTFVEMAGVHEQWIEELFSGLTPEELHILQLLLGKLKHSLEVRGTESGAMS